MNDKRMDVFRKADGWIVENLRKYGNSVIPETLLKYYSASTIEKMLSLCVGDTVRIQKTVFMSPPGHIAVREYEGRSYGG